MKWPLTLTRRGPDSPADAPYPSWQEVPDEVDVEILRANGFEVEDVTPLALIEQVLQAIDDHETAATRAAGFDADRERRDRDKADLDLYGVRREVGEQLR